MPGVAKNRKYKKLLASRLCHLLIAAVETGGRLGTRSIRLPAPLFHVAKAKASSVPSVLKLSMVTAWVKRWTSRIAFAVHEASAACLIEESVGTTLPTDGPAPCLGAVLNNYVEAHDEQWSRSTYTPTLLSITGIRV